MQISRGYDLSKQMYKLLYRQSKAYKFKFTQCIDATGRKHIVEQFYYSKYSEEMKSTVDK